MSFTSSYNDELSADAFDRMFSKIMSYNKEYTSHKYPRILVGASLAASMFYLWSYYRMKKIIPGHLATMVLALCAWNIITSCLMDTLLFGLLGMIEDYSKFKSSILNVLKNLISYSILANYNNKLIVKDTRLFVVTVIGLVLFMVAQSHALSYITSIRRTAQPDLESAVPTELNEKAVLPKSNLKSIIKHGLKYALYFIGALSVTVIILPNFFLLNSSATLHSDSPFIKFDVLFWAANGFFMIVSIKQLIKSISKTHIGPIKMLVYVGLLYNGVVLVISNSLMVLFSDLLVNMLVLMVDKLQNNHHFHDYGTNLVTSVLLNVFAHLVDDDCLYKVCSETDDIDVMARNLMHFKEMFTDCMVVLHLASFVIIPLLFWIILVEVKSTRIFVDKNST